MGVDGIGSSVIVALAAVLWFVYLVPTWLRRREYLATERNAVRLQQTIRIMAESAEIPDVVRVEANARTISAQERALREQERAQRQQERALRLRERQQQDAVLSQRGAGDISQHNRTFPPTRIASSGHFLARRAAARLRRCRALATLVLLVSVVGGVLGIGSLSSSGSWMLLAASSVGAIGAVALLNRAAAVSRARARAKLRRSGSSSQATAAIHDDADFAREVEGWTPIPVPKPLYLSRPAARAVASYSDHDAILRVASAEAERLLREAEAEPEVVRFEPRALPVAAEPVAISRFARMGFVESADAAPTDLDAILSRRRKVG